MTASSEAESAELPLLDWPRGGVPSVVDTLEGLEEAARRLAAGRGPVGVDAERASGIRYGQRAFLAQFKRAGAGIVLIDTETLRLAGADFSSLAAALDGPEWILHSAMQDLPCLAELGLTARQVFDTEIAARLAGFERFGLGAVVERTLGVRLAKEHSNSDWSKRPLPLAWLTYAALDVEVLDDVREALIVELAAQGKLEWAYEEFEHILAQGLPEPKQDPWRRLSGISSLKSRHALAVARSLWQAREELARNKDVSPGQILPDSAILAAVKASPRTVPQLLGTPGFHGRQAKREAPRWLQAIKDGAASQDLPELRLPSPGGIPQPRSWEQRRPQAFARFNAARAAVARLAEDLRLPAENLLQPAALRHVCWHAGDAPSRQDVDRLLADADARPWQREALADVLAHTFAVSDAESA
ncbi:HRDC domain-containing protein [Falsarthrobacter nasiphocae]|uniref:Ribonuclease D n=1 Tax=Falsarthrobacter nasiphocae TaxID=189863 RepID=A0AAE3YFG9_9MICC|nr:HRDC domain-containing protein [Falsarthrobacter nasiphocae]MDR6891252.1 ribonuclease D [Falsarthrobacter nasiphocae]